MQMASQHLILGDWGTSVCRLYLCAWNGHSLDILDRLKGKGIKNNADPESSFFALCEHWFERVGPAPVYLIGTVGADIGWHTTSYVSCPTDQQQLFLQASKFSARNIQFTILPGLSCTNIHGLPDIMRGEETQIFGFLANTHAPQQERLICLPGTHTKWAWLNEGEIKGFVTSPVGELYDMLNHHSVLLGNVSASSWCNASFETGLQTGLNPTSNLLHTLFATRAMQVLNQQAHAEAASYLSGLLVGADVKAAMQDFHLFSEVTLIGSAHICSLYVAALEKLKINAHQIDSETATLNGLQAIAAPDWEHS